MHTTVYTSAIYFYWILTTELVGITKFFINDAALIRQAAEVTVVSTYQDLMSLSDDKPQMVSSHTSVPTSSVCSMYVILSFALPIPITGPKIFCYFHWISHTN